MNKILEIENLSVSIDNLNIIRNISLCIYKNDILAIVGESASGKSLLCKTIMKFKSNIRKTGKIYFLDKDIDEYNITKIRGSKISYVFQNPMQSLNPSIKVGKQIDECILIHNKTSKKQAKLKTFELLNKVGLDKSYYNKLPNQLSGGQCQRVVIAIAIANNPSLVICDEPTTSLDYETQKLILDLLKSLNITIILITHDLNIVKDFANKVIVMYAGEFLELAYTDEIFSNPLHPYTKCLLSNNPQIKGIMVDYANVPNYDIFADRNPLAQKIDFEKKPPLIEAYPNHYVKSWLYYKENNNE